jgi:cytochrome c-type biogenesis protein CcmF
MLSELGFLAMFLAFVAALYAIGAALYGARKHADHLAASARNAALATAVLILLACGLLVAALVGQQYQNAYVWTVSAPDTPPLILNLFGQPLVIPIYRIAALWGSQSGSLLFWSMLMSIFAAGAIALNWTRHRRLMPYVIAYTMATVAFFLALSVFLENPFERFWIMPDNTVVESIFVPAGAVVPSSARLAETANGLNPLLRHFGMMIHPPMLYLGFVGFIIPFAFAMAALASGDLSTNWIKVTRRWALVAWVFLSLGLILGGRWAYDVLGWGGYWGWDPVENAAFLPWLVGTAFLHSVMIQEKRGMLKVWNMFLVIGTFSAVIFGTFATRSGLVDSVHSFARSPIGVPLFLFWLGMTLVSVSLILYRWRRGELKDERRFANLLSRESLFVLNNVVFIMLFVAIFWGSFGAPIISEIVMNTNITLGRDYFNAVAPPLFLALFVLMGLAPLSAWGSSSIVRLGKAMLVPILLALAFIGFMFLTGTRHGGALIGYFIVSLAGFVALYEIYRGVMARRRSLHEGWWKSLTALFARNRRRYGGYVIHLGITVIGIGVIASTLFQQETQQTLGVGESMDFGGYTMTYDGFRGGQIAEDGRLMDIALVTVSRGGQKIAELRPRRDLYPNVQESNSMTIAGTHSTLEGDFYVLLVSWNEITAQNATFKVYINPLINLVWWGGIVLIIGTVVAAWPHEPEPVVQARAASPARRAGVSA